MSTLFKFTLALAISLFAVFPAAAQDGSGLTDDQRALLDRITAAINAEDSYASYVEHSVETTSNSMTITLGTASLHNDETTVLERSINAIQGETKNTYAMLAAQVEGTDSSTGTYSYTLNAEVRLVDGVLYVKATRDTPTEDQNLPDLPEGWIEVQNVDDWPALSLLHLGSFLDLPDDSNIFDYPEVLVKSVTAITVDAVTLDDDTAADLITLTFEADGLKTALAEFNAASGNSDDTLLQTLDLIDPGSQMTARFTLNADDQMLRFEGDAQLIWTGLDMRQFTDQAPEGSTMDLTTGFASTRDISGIDTPLNPVAAPAVD